MLSYSTFGSAEGPSPRKMAIAKDLVRQHHPELEVDGEIQVDIATNAEVRVPEFPFSTLKDNANVFVFPNLDSANIGYQMLANVGGAEVIGPGAHRHAEAGERAADGLLGAGHREPRGHHRAARAGREVRVLGLRSSR